MRTGILVWIALLALCVGYLSLTAESLPSRVPVRFGLGGEPVGWLGRGLFLGWMIVFLGGLNALFAYLHWYLAGDRLPRRVRIPWRAYWLATEQRERHAVERLRDLITIAGLVANASWLLSYHLVMQQVGAAIFFQIPIDFGVYLIGVGALALVYASFAYFRPP